MRVLEKRIRQRSTPTGYTIRCWVLLLLPIAIIRQRVLTDIAFVYAITFTYYDTLIPIKFWKAAICTAAHIHFWHLY